MVSFHEWLMAQVDWRVSSGAMKGKRFTFDAFPCQIDIVRDESRSIAIIKSAQMAASEQFTVARPFYYMDVHKINWGILFPDQGAMRNFFKTRLKASIHANRHIRQRVTAENEGNIDAFGYTLFLRYTTTEAAIATFDANGVTVDEMDLHNKETLFGARTSRTQGSMDQPFWHEISTPTFPKAGIHQSFLDGNQFVWLVRCQSCQYDNDMTSRVGQFDSAQIEEFFTEFLNEKRFPRWQDYFVPCSECGKKIDPVVRFDPAKHSFGGGRWVARYPDRDAHSYHLQIWQRLYRAGTPEVLQRMKRSLQGADTPEKKARWHNSTVGLVYVPREGKLLDEDLDKASTSIYDEVWVRDMLYPDVYRIHGEDWDWMGTDIRDGQYHVFGLKRFSDTRNLVVGVGWVRDGSQLRELWERMGEPFHVPDQLPDVNATRVLAKSMGRRCARGSLGKGLQITFAPINEDGIILISRPKVMEAVKASIESMSWIVPRPAWNVGAGIFQERGDKRREDTLRDHFKAPTMVKEYSAAVGNYVYDFPHDAMGGIDPHYFMAACFAYVASKTARAPSHAITIPR